MSVRMKRETIEVGSLLRAPAQHITVEGEAALPGGLRDEVRVFHAEAAAVPLTAEAVGGHLTASGRVTFRALYAQGDLTRVRSVEAISDFSRQMPLSAQANGARFVAASEVTGASARVFNGRLLFRAEVGLTAEAEETSEKTVVTAVEEEGAQVLGTPLTMQRVVGAGEETEIVRGEFELADVLQADDTLLASAQARVEDITGGENGRANVTGTLELSACHASHLSGRPVVCTQHSLPFEKSVALSGERGDLLSAEAIVTDVGAVSEDTGGGARVLRAEVGIRVSLRALKEQSARVVTDVFSASGAYLVPVNEKIVWRRESLNEQTAESARVQMLLPESAPRIKTALAAFTRPVLVGVSAQNGKLSADVLMQSTLLYMTEDSGIPLAHTQEEPMRLVFSCTALPDDALSLSASHVEAAAVAGDRAEIRCVVTLHASGARYGELSAVTDVARGEAARKDGSLCLYMTEPGDRLWDVMKRYRVSGGALAAFNEQLTDLPPETVLEPGTRVIAYNR